MSQDDVYLEKYLKYKAKYLELKKNQSGGYCDYKGCDCNCYVFPDKKKKDYSNCAKCRHKHEKHSC